MAVSKTSSRMSQSAIERARWVHKRQLSWPQFCFQFPETCKGDRNHKAPAVGQLPLEWRQGSPGGYPQHWPLEAQEISPLTPSCLSKGGAAAATARLAPLANTSPEVLLNGKRVSV